MKKGDVLAVARVAGIQAAKAQLGAEFLCATPLPLTGIDLSFYLSDDPCMVENSGGRYLHRRRAPGWRWRP